jgi:hypothetical protein
MLLGHVQFLNAYDKAAIRCYTCACVGPPVSKVEEVDGRLRGE